MQQQRGHRQLVKFKAGDVAKSADKLFKIIQRKGRTKGTASCNMHEANCLTKLNN